MKYKLDFNKSIHGFTSGWQGNLTLTVNGVVVYSWGTAGTNIDEQFKIVQGIFCLEYEFIDKCVSGEEEVEIFYKLRDKTIERMNDHGWGRYAIHPVDVNGPLPITVISDYVVCEEHGLMYFDHDKFLTENYTL